MDETKKKMMIPALVAIVSAVLLYFLLFTGFSVGRVFNVVIQCVSNPENSFPCYGVYDVFTIIISLLAFIVSVAMLFWHSYKQKMFRRRK